MTNLGFHITSTDIICGIEVVVTRRDHTTLNILLDETSTIADNSVRLINGGALIGSGNLWGTSTLLPSDINSSGFGVAIAAQLTGLSASA